MQCLYIESVKVSDRVKQEKHPHAGENWGGRDAVWEQAASEEPAEEEVTAEVRTKTKYKIEIKKINPQTVYPTKLHLRKAAAAETGFSRDAQNVDDITGRHEGNGRKGGGVVQSECVLFA